LHETVPADGNVENASDLQRHAIAAARQAGVAQVVSFPHSAVAAFEFRDRPDASSDREGLWESGLAWTMLRPHHFMQNLLGQADNIINDGVVYSSSGDGRIPFVDTRDIAAVAAVTLTEPGHTQTKYVITGGEALSYRQATDILAEAIAGHCASSTSPSTSARARLTRAGQPAWLVDSLLAIAGVPARGRPDGTITSVVADLTGKPPRTFPAFARDNAAAFYLPERRMTPQIPLGSGFGSRTTASDVLGDRRSMVYASSSLAGRQAWGSRPRAHWRAPVRVSASARARRQRQRRRSPGSPTWRSTRSTSPTPRRSTRSRRPRWPA